MINFIVLTIVVLIGLWFYLKKAGMERGDMWLLVLSIGWSFFFFSFGSTFMKSVWANVNAADFFIIFSIAFWGGMGLFAALPSIRHKNWQKVKKILLFFMGIGLVYIAIDNIGLGPSAVGPYSPYRGQDLCNLDATFYAEDVAAGCFFVQKLGIYPFGQEANFIVYVLFTLALILGGIRLIGVKKVGELIGG